MLLDDTFKANIDEMKADEVKKEADTKSYLKNINIDSVGEATKKALKTDFGYTLALSTLGGVGLSIYFHSFQPLVYGVVGGLVTYVVLTLAEKANILTYK